MQLQPRMQSGIPDVNKIVKKIADELRQELNPASSVNAARNQLKQQVMRSVCDYYGITVRILTTSNRRGIVSEARVLTIILLDRHTELESAQIADIFKCHCTLVHKRIRAFRKALSGDNSEKIYGSEEFVAKYKEVNAQILKYKKEKRIKSSSSDIE